MKLHRLASTTASIFRRVSHADKFYIINALPNAISGLIWSRKYSSAIELVKAASWSHPTHAGGSETPMAAPGCDNQRKRQAYIALGSNLGDRIAMIEQACKEMSARGITVRRTSSLWETKPMYVIDQGAFINGACEVGIVFIGSSMVWSDISKD
jgi:7,8-dihydro-6-hydroxymethylpterin-pyrophosphokinase (HPPK)